MKRFLASMMVTGIVLVLGQLSTASALSLILSSGGSSATFTDIDADGIVNEFATVGDWKVNLSLASSKPFIGSELSPAMNLLALVSRTGIGSEQLTIEVTDDGFTGLAPGFATIANSAYNPGGAFVGVESFLDGSSFSTIGPVSGEFNERVVGNPSITTTPYTLSFVATVDGLALGQAMTFDVGLTALPEPGTVMLLGFGLLGLGIYTRKRKNF